MDGRGCYVAIDRDPSVRDHFAAFVRDHPDMRTRFVRGNSSASRSGTSPRRACAPTRVLLDLGVSSMQIDRAERGFSYAADAPLDMRMDPAERDRGRPRERVPRGRAAADLRALRRGALLATDRAGDRPPPRRGAAPPLERARGRRGRRSRRRRSSARATRPRVFQALRIAVNDELGRAPGRPRAALDLLVPGGRLAVSFPFARGPHREGLPSPRGARVHLPAGPPGVRVRPRAAAADPDVARRQADAGRDRRNPRAASARLRAGERTAVTAEGP